MPENNCPPIIKEHYGLDCETESGVKTRKMVAGHNLYTATKDSRAIEEGAAKTYPE